MEPVYNCFSRAFRFYGFPMFFHSWRNSRSSVTLSFFTTTTTDFLASMHTYSCFLSHSRKISLSIFNSSSLHSRQGAYIGRRESSCWCERKIEEEGWGGRGSWWSNRDVWCLMCVFVHFLFDASPSASVRLLFPPFLYFSPRLHLYKV